MLGCELKAEQPFCCKEPMIASNSSIGFVTTADLRCAAVCCISSADHLVGTSSSLSQLLVRPNLQSLTTFKNTPRTFCADACYNCVLVGCDRCPCKDDAEVAERSLVAGAGVA